MTSTLCQRVALGHIIAPWVVKIAELFGIMVKTMLLMVGNVSNGSDEPRVCCRKAGWRGLLRTIWPCLYCQVSMTLQDAFSCRPRSGTGQITETAGVFHDVFPSAPR